MMTSKQVVKDTMKFRNPERLAIDLPKNMVLM